MKKIKISKSQRYTFAILLLVAFGVIIGYNMLSNNQGTNDTLAKKRGETHTVTEPIFNSLNYPAANTRAKILIPLTPVIETSNGC
ncbi:MAG TPA: hypothetical protein DIW31_05665 [Bacteroidales bacterium]|nr:hypothetical protein [Bacteroidales bacterium]